MVMINKFCITKCMEYFIFPHGGETQFPPFLGLPTVNLGNLALSEAKPTDAFWHVQQTEKPHVPRWAKSMIPQVSRDALKTLQSSHTLAIVLSSDPECFFRANFLAAMSVFH